MVFDKVLKLLGRLDTEGKAYFSDAVSAFFEETIASDAFFCEDDLFDLDRFKEEVGEDIFSPLFITAVEFFLSNEYADGEKSWNALDTLLQKRGSLLPVQDKMYLKGLRQSYMSIFEVINVKIDQAITVRNILETNAPEEVIKEKQGTHHLYKWDLIGARLVKTPRGTFFAGGLLLLDRDTANKAKNTIDDISKIMMGKKNLRYFQKTTKDPVLMIKKMWAKEIVQNWFIQKIREKIHPEFVNYEGDPLEFYTVEFPLNGPLEEIVDRISNLPNIVHYEIEGYPHAWLWTPDKNYHNEKKSKKQKDNKEFFIGTQLNDQDGELRRYKAELKIQEQVLRISINSKKRAHEAAAFFKESLESLLGDSTYIKSKENTPIEENNASGEKNLPSEEETVFIQKMIDQYYKGWIDSPLPFLNGKTPRQAVKSKKSRDQVIDLLKDMQNLEVRRIKSDGKMHPYNFDRIFIELGLDQNSI